MSGQAIRVTRQDFAIPPEFRGYRLPENTAGQVGGVRLALEHTGGHTRLGRCYQQVPLRVLPPFGFQDEPCALLYLLNPTAGLMDGDAHLVEIDAGPASCAVVTGQSATRVHPAVSSFATQQWRVHVARGAQLVVLPGPIIPFRGCRYHQRVEIELEAEARLIWGDIWTPGRYARDERSEHYEFGHIIQELEVRRSGRLVHRERFHWEGPWDPLAVRWHAGGGKHCGTAGVYVTGPVARADAASESMHKAVLPLAEGDTLIRWCGPVGPLIHDVVVTALGQAAMWSGDEARGPWLLGSNHLGPSHWFSVFLDGAGERNGAGGRPLASRSEGRHPE